MVQPWPRQRGIIICMIGEIQENNSVLYRCGSCGSHYLSRGLAEQCDRWCAEHQTCNVEIIQYAIENRGGF